MYIHFPARYNNYSQNKNKINIVKILKSNWITNVVSIELFLKFDVNKYNDYIALETHGLSSDKL